MLRSLEKINQKLARRRNNCHFNTKCVHSNVVPKCFHLKSPVKGRTAEVTIKKAEKRLLNIAIAQGKFTIRKLNEEKETLLDKISREVSEDDATAILDYTTTSYEMEFAATKDRQQRKFHKIKGQNNEQTNKEETVIDKKRWVKNISSHTISEDEERILSRG